MSAPYLPAIFWVRHKGPPPFKFPAADYLVTFIRDDGFAFVTDVEGPIINGTKLIFVRFGHETPHFQWSTDRKEWSDFPL